MCDCSDGYPSVYHSKQVVGRKDYKCCECGVALPKGTKHEYVWGLWDGSSGTYRTCLDCVAVRDRVSAEVEDFCYSHGNFFTQLEECEIVFRQKDEEAIGRYCSIAPESTLDWLVFKQGSWRVAA